MPLRAKPLVVGVFVSPTQVELLDRHGIEIVQLIISAHTVASLAVLALQIAQGSSARVPWAETECFPVCLLMTLRRQDPPLAQFECGADPLSEGR
jgi:hypothetical protein